MALPRPVSMLAFCFAFAAQAIVLWLAIAPHLHAGPGLDGDHLFQAFLITGAVGLAIVFALLLAALAVLAVVVATSAAFANVVGSTLYGTHAQSNRALAWFAASLVPWLVVGGTWAWRTLR